MMKNESTAVALSEMAPVNPRRKLINNPSDIDNLKFSIHAQRRMTSRAIVLSRDDLAKLINAIDKAASKGSRDALVLLKDLAFVVNITNRTVVTAMDEESIRENIFTNIDSAVLA